MRPAYGVWLGAVSASTLGDAVTYFALGWTASEFGAGAASLVLTASSVPLFVVILAGGVVADRFGVRRTMVSCDLAMVLVLVLFMIHVLRGPSVLGLMCFALASGTAAAMRRPAEGVFPRLFATDEELPKAMAQVNLVQQVARFAGPPLGGLLLALSGLLATAAFDAVTFLVVAIVLVWLRPPRETSHRTSPKEPAFRSILASVQVARRTPGVPATLVGILVLAAGALTTLILCVPLVGRERGWTAAETGLVSSCWVFGSFLVTGLVARRGAPNRWLSALGPVIGSLGVCLLAFVDMLAIGAAGTGLLGIGTVLYTARAFPRFVRLSPPPMLARFQALMHLSQNVGVVIALPILGLVAGRFSPSVSLVLIGLLMAVGGLFEVVVARRGNAVGGSGTPHS